MPLPLPYAVFSPFSSTTLIVPRLGARPIKVEKARPRAALPKTGQFGLSAEPRPTAQVVTLRLLPPPPASVLYAQTPQGLARSEAFEDWLEQAVKRLVAQKPGRIAATYALEVTAPRTARTRQFGAMERPLIEAFARSRIIRRGLSPEKFSVTYGGTGAELTVTVSDFSAP